MAIVYDKDGNEFKVNHQIDVAEWLKSGYYLENPKPKKETKPKPLKEENQGE